MGSLMLRELGLPVAYFPPQTQEEHLLIPVIFEGGKKKSFAFIMAVRIIITLKNYWNNCSCFPLSSSSVPIIKGSDLDRGEPFIVTAF